MSMRTRLAVVAIGGNALIRDDRHRTIADQYDTARATMAHVVDLIESGWRVVLTHGSGPQMGFILRRSELALPEVAPVPMDYASADLQGSLGYMFVKALGNEMRRRGMRRDAVAVVTQVLVHRDDPAFLDPTKPIGMPMDEEVARRLAAELGWQVRHDPGGGWRRVVPSPQPIAIVDLPVIERLVDEDFIVVACGGGGIPVMQDAGGDIVGIEAVIDKDTASSLLARKLRAERLLIVTGVDRVALDYGNPGQRWIDRLTRVEAVRLLDQNEFDKGSMGPKIAAIVDFLENDAAEGIITDPPHIAAALAGNAGTRIVPQ